MSLVALSWESAATSVFQHWIDAHQGDVSHIFVDKYYVAITESNFQPTIQHLVAQLQRYNAPITYLTATAPASCFSLFCEALCLPPFIDVYRAPVQRHNISYIVINTPRNKIVGAVKTFLQTETRELRRAGTKGIMFVNSVDIGNQWSAIMGCAFYHSGAPFKDKMLQDFASGQLASPWLVATSGAGTGLDINNISLVLHIERPYGLVSYIQQSGRCACTTTSVGRSVMFVKVSATRDAWSPSRSTDSFAMADQAALTRYITHRGCRQESLESFFKSPRLFKSCIEAIAISPMRVVQCNFCDRLTCLATSEISTINSKPIFDMLNLDTIPPLPVSSIPPPPLSLPASALSTYPPAQSYPPLLFSGVRFISPTASLNQSWSSSSDSLHLSADICSSSPPLHYAPPAMSAGL